MQPCTIIWDDVLASYRFTPDHPLDPRRLELTLDLIRELGLLDGGHRITPARRASNDEIRTVHAAEYVAAVESASAAQSASAGLLRYGLGTADVPIVPGMHDAAAHVAGATLRAAELVMNGSALRTFSIAGGLHHARTAEASGFCVYNDLAIAIRWMQRTHGVRVLYIDIDAHHGDGVQQIFYDDPDVLTLSFHESGAFLYPGTGFIDERGGGDGYGYSINVPLDPLTGDDSYLECLHAIAPGVAQAFGPDVIVLQAGCDAHALDPLTHLRCTTGFYREAAGLVCEIADEHCGGRIIATGGGGYAIHEVVPRAWSLVWAALSQQDPGDDVPRPCLERLEREAGRAMPTTLLDPPVAPRPSPGSRNAAAVNRATIAEVLESCLPLIRS